MISLSLNGSRELRREIRAAGERRRAAVEAVVERYTVLIAREMQGLAPVDTGRLRGSIGSELRRIAGQVVGYVFARADHAIYPELGVASNPNYPRQPYLRPALETHRAAFYRDLKRAAGRGES